MSTGSPTPTGNSAPPWPWTRKHCASATATRASAAAASAASLDQLSAFKGNDGWQFTLRWVLLHLIEETARHAGHADLLREAIDGSVGE
jgi:Protein of unknown function (DUF664)